MAVTRSWRFYVLFFFH